MFERWMALASDGRATRFTRVPIIIIRVLGCTLDVMIIASKHEYRIAAKLCTRILRRSKSE